MALHPNSKSNTIKRMEKQYASERTQGRYDVRERYVTAGLTVLLRPPPSKAIAKVYFLSFPVQPALRVEYSSTGGSACRSGTAR